MASFRPSLVISTVIVAVLTGCASQQTGQTQSSSPGVLDQVGQSVQDFGNRVAAAAHGPATPVTTQNTGPTIESTPLFRIFAKAEYDTTKKLAVQFPRVALRVLTVPPAHNALWQLQNASGCWTLSATLWKTRTASTPVGPFTICVPRDMPNEIGLGKVLDWAGKAGFHSVSDETTGNKRTDGPVPPSTPIPKDVGHQHFWAPEGQMVPAKMDAAMFGAVLAKMNFDWSVDADRRVWIVQFDPAEAQ